MTSALSTGSLNGTDVGASCAAAVAGRVPASDCTSCSERDARVAARAEAGSTSPRCDCAFESSAVSIGPDAEADCASYSDGENDRSGDRTSWSGGENDRAADGCTGAAVAGGAMIVATRSTSGSTMRARGCATMSSRLSLDSDGGADSESNSGHEDGCAADGGTEDALDAGVAGIADRALAVSMTLACDVASVLGRVSGRPDGAAASR
jgi:hypothetical protein